MSFSTFFNNPFTTFSSGYASSYSSIDSTYSTSSTGSSPPYSPTQQYGEAGLPETAMYPLLKPVTASRPVTGTVSTLLDTQPRPTIISNRHTLPVASTSNTSYTTASLSLTKLIYGKLGRTGAAPSITSSGTSTPRHGRSRSAVDVLNGEARSREASATRVRREQRELERRNRIQETARILKEELEREGFYVPTEGFDEVNLAARDPLYKHGRVMPQAASEIVLNDEDGPYAEDRRAGRRSSVMVPGPMNTEERASSDVRCLSLEEQEANDQELNVEVSREVNGDGIGSPQEPTKRPPTTHESPEEHQQPAQPAEAAKPDQHPLPVPAPVASDPVSHPPTPPLSLSGDEAKEGAISILPAAPTPPPTGKNDLFDPFLYNPGIVIPAELPAIEKKVPPPESADNASNKGKQKEPEHLEPQIVEAIPDDNEIDALVGKIPVTDFDQWENQDRDGGAQAAAAVEATTAIAKEKIVAKPEEEKEVHILPVAEPPVEEDPLPVVEAPIYVSPIQIAAPVPEQPKVEPRRLEDEAVTEVAREFVETVVSDIADAVDTPVSPISKEVEVPASIVEEAITLPKTEVIAPEPEKKVEEISVETVKLVDIVEVGPSEPIKESETPLVDEKEKSQAPAIEEKKKEVSLVSQIVDVTPEEDITKVIPAQGTVSEASPAAESAPVPEDPAVVKEDITPVKEDVAPVKEDVEPAEEKTATVIDADTQPPMTPPTEKELEFPPVAVSPRIPTPPDAAGNSLDWDRFIEEICKTHDDDDVPVPKTEELVSEIVGVVAVGGSEPPKSPKEETFTIPSVPESTLPQDVIEDLTPPPLKYTPAPLPPRKIADEEKPSVREITSEAATSVPEPVQGSLPVKSDMLDLPEFGNQQAPEEQPRTRPRAPPSLISRPSLADIREEAELGDDVAVIAAAARVEPVTFPITDVNPVEPIKPVEPEVMSTPSPPSPPPVRNLSDEMADVGKTAETGDEQWVPKFKETGPGAAVEESEIRPATAVEESEIRPATAQSKTAEVEASPPLERVVTQTPSVKERSGLRKLGRALTFGNKKQTPMGDSRPGTSHSAAVSIGSVDDDKRSMAESTKRPNFLNRTTTKRVLTLGLAGKDKEKKKDDALAADSQPGTPAGKAASIRSVSGAISPSTESAPSTPKRSTRDLMKLAVGMRKKMDATSGSAPASPVDGGSPTTTPLASPPPVSGKRFTNAVNLMMKKKRDQDAKVKSAEAQAAAATAAAASPPATPVSTPVANPVATPAAAAPEPTVESASPTPPAATETPAEETPAPAPAAPRRRNTLTMNNAANLLMLRKKVKEDKTEAEKSAPSAPGTPGADDSAVAVDDDKPQTPSATEAPAETSADAPQPIKRRNTLTLKGATDLMAFRKKVKENKEEHDKANGSSDAAVDDTIVGSAAEVSPPATPTPKRRGTISMGNAVNLMMMRKNKEKERGKERESDESSPDGDVSATPKKERRMSAMFGRRKSTQNSPTIGASASRPLTPSTPAAEAMKSTTSFAPPPLDSEHPGIGLAIDADSSKQQSKAPSVYSVDQRPGTSASTRNFGGLFKKRTPSVYSKDIPDSVNPFNAPNSPFPAANGAERSSLNHSDSPPGVPSSEGGTEAGNSGKPKLNRRWTMALGAAKGKANNKLANAEVPSSSGEPPATAGTTTTVDRPPTRASVGPGSPSKIPVPVSTVGTVPLTSANAPVAANGEKRPKLANRAMSLMAFNKKKK